MPVAAFDRTPAAPAWPSAAEHPRCLHCGDPCVASQVTTEAGIFCCTGCVSVFTLLNERGLAAFYACDIPSGVSQRSAGHLDPDRFRVLDDPAVRRRFVLADDGQRARVRFSVPSLHCASCVWLLERLGRVDDRIGRTEVDLLRRTVDLTFDSSRMALSAAAAVLAEIGYEPLLTAEAPAPRTPERRRLYAQIGVAGFAFGNIMLFSIPRYANGAPLTGGFQHLFDALNLALALPVLVFSASDFFRGAWQALRHRTINLDVPIVIGLAALVSRSVLDISTGRGEGYLDSFAGLVFFLLIGRLFQQQAFDWIGFDRTFRSFFPLSVLVEDPASQTTQPVSIDRLRPGDRVVLRPEEVVPVDATLVDDRAFVDYAFLSGEREPIEVGRGDLVRAGGRITRTSARFDVLREVIHSELADLWAAPATTRPAHWLTMVSARFGAWFVVVALVLAAGGAVFWWPDHVRALEVATAVLIVACPCALTLSAPITLGTAMTVLGRKGWYLKDPATVLDLSRVDSIVFDKTGTLTASGEMAVSVPGLDGEERELVGALTSGSLHPISRALAAPSSEGVAVSWREEVPGLGIRGEVNGRRVAVGSAAFMAGECAASSATAGGTFVAIDGVVRAAVEVSAPVRPGIAAAIEALAADHRVSLLSGDRDAGDSRWTRLFGTDARFGQSAREKRAHVAALEGAGRHVLMVGDGLNDAGAFEAAGVALAVSDETACLVPACEVIVSGNRLAVLPRVLAFARHARRTIVICFVVSLLYNAVGLSLALAGLLSPLVAAILMPVSSLSVVGISVGLTRWGGRRVPAV